MKRTYYEIKYAKDMSDIHYHPQVMTIENFLEAKNVLRDLADVLLGYGAAETTIAITKCEVEVPEEVPEDAGEDG